MASLVWDEPSRGNVPHGKFAMVVVVLSNDIRKMGTKSDFGFINIATKLCGRK